jgi:serine/threonine protein kinase
MSEQLEPSPREETPVMPPGCPDENALAELVQGLLDDVVASQIELHLDDCEDCRRIVSAVGQSSYLAARRTRVDSGRAEGSNPPASTWVGKSEPLHIPEPGTILAGKYRVDGVLGQGGMGVVLAATHVTLNKLVALKLMRPDLAVDKGASQRFVREARAASLLRSEHIVRVIDLDTLADGSPYIAMEYLEGEDLGAVLVRAGAISAHEAATYIVQVCEAIAEAHAANIVHRDLKPANLFLTRRANTPCVKVLDFGVSKIIAGGPLVDDVASTDTKSLVGSPHYMAPEQLISAKSVDPRTDVWALGCILFELVSGRSPFNTGGALAQVLASILRDNAPSLRDLCPSLPDGFVAVVERCLEKDPSRRFQRVDELAAALVPFTAGPSVSPALGRTTAIGVGTPAPMIPVEIAVGQGPSAAATTARTTPSRGSTRAWIIAAALVLLVAGGYAGYRAMQSEPAVVEAPKVEMPVKVEPPPAPVSEPPRVEPTPAVEPSRLEPATKPKPAKKKPAAKKLEDDLIGPSFE